MSVIIETSYFGNHRSIMPLTHTPIAISRWPPRTWRGLRYPALAPTVEMMKGNLSLAQFEKQFMDRLYSLDPEAVAKEIMAMVPRGTIPTLLCFESPDDVCHRRWVAEWLEANLEIVVPELGFERDEIETYFDWK